MIYTRIFARSRGAGLSTGLPGKSKSSVSSPQCRKWRYQASPAGVYRPSRFGPPHQENWLRAQFARRNQNPSSRVQTASSNREIKFGLVLILLVDYLHGAAIFAWFPVHQKTKKQNKNQISTTVDTEKRNNTFFSSSLSLVTLLSMAKKMKW